MIEYTKRKGKFMIKIEHEDLKQFLEPIVWSDTKNGYNAVFKEDLVGIVDSSVEVRCGEPTDFALLNRVQESDKGAGFKSWTKKTKVDGYSFVREIPVLVSKAYKSRKEVVYASERNVGVSPYIRLNLGKVVKYLEDSGQANPSILDVDGESQYILFGEYPQTICSKSEAVELEVAYTQMHMAKLKGIPYVPQNKEDEMIETGKKYLLDVKCDTQRQCVVDVETGREILFQNQKYVEVPRTDYHKISSSILSNGKEIQKAIDGSESNLWAFFYSKVEPIKWKILNWQDMPKSINPVGTGKAKYIECMSDRILVGGLPYHINESSQYATLYQNSTIRGFLNGINVEDAKNMNERWFLAGGGDFKKFGISFLNSAFSDISCEIKIEKETGEIKYSKKRARGYGLKLKKNISVEEQIKYYINSGKSFMLHGPSGVGKSRRVAEADPNFVSIVLRNGILPEEVIGKTIYKNTKGAKAGEWMPPMWYKTLCDICENQPDKNHVLFIDEITNVKPSEQSLVFHLVLNHSIGPNMGHLPKNAVVVAAGNSKEESEAAYNMPEPLFRRFEGHIELRPNHLDFIDWGSRLNEEGRPRIHPVITTYLASFWRKAFYTPYNEEEPPKYAIDPRGWEQLSEMIYQNDGEIVYELLENKIGEELAKSFWAFLETPMITVEDIIQGTFTLEDIPTDYDKKFALALSLQGVDVENLKKVREFVGRYLSKEILAVFDSAWVGNDDERALIISALGSKVQMTF